MGYYSKGTWTACPVIGGKEHSVIWLTEDEPLKSITDNMGEERWFVSEHEAEICAAGMNAPKLLIKMIKEHEGKFESVIDVKRAWAMLKPISKSISSIIDIIEHDAGRAGAGYHDLSALLESLPDVAESIASAEFSIYHGINLNGGVPFNKEAGDILFMERIGIAILDLKTALGGDIFDQLINNAELELEFCCFGDMVYNMGLTSFLGFINMIPAAKKAIPLGCLGDWREVAKEAKDSDWWRKNSKMRQRIPQMFETGEYIEVE